MKSRIFSVLFSAALLSASFLPQIAHAASVSFIEPADGAVVSSPFTVKFGVSGMEVKPARDMTPGTGHHHLLINQDSISAGQSIPVDEKHLHFGKGQTEANITLPPPPIQADHAVCQQRASVLRAGTEQDHQRHRQISAGDRQIGAMVPSTPLE